VVLRHRQITPATCCQIRIGAHAKVCTVYVAMTAVGRHKVGALVERANVRPQTIGIQFNNPRDCIDVRVGKEQLSTDPIHGNVAIRIGIGQPDCSRIYGCEVL
jgi:hypothetical protein